MVLAFSRWIREQALPKLKIKVTALPISISINPELALHVIDFSGRVQFSELGELGRVHAQNLPWASADTFHIIADDADLSALTHAHLDAMRAHYRQLHQSIDFFMLRRSGWVCGSADACRLVEYWLHDRHSRDGQGTEVFLAAALDELGDLFSEDEIEAARTRGGFTEQVRIDHCAKR
jgi:hypothetical protein